MASAAVGEDVAAVVDFGFSLPWGFGAKFCGQETWVGTLVAITTLANPQVPTIRF